MNNNGKMNNNERSVKDAVKELISLDPASIRVPVDSNEVVRMMSWYMKRVGAQNALEKLPPIVHVAGTKGKGSTCAFVESMLRKMGLRTALYTSPHLVDIRERFRQDGEPMEMEPFLSLFWSTFDQLKATKDDEINFPNPENFRLMPGYFYFLTLMALQIFTKDNVDVLILEVGLGGRLDSTTVPLASVSGISMLDLDHCEILGDTIALIAGEKAGIIKPNVPSFTVPQVHDAMQVLDDTAARVGSSLTVIHPLCTITSTDDNMDSSNLEKRAKSSVDYDIPELGLAGDFQQSNAALALALCQQLLHLNPDLAAKSSVANVPTKWTGPEWILKQRGVVSGLETCQWPGRAQTVVTEAGNDKSVVFFMDGAHSPRSLECCMDWFTSAATKHVAQQMPVRLMLFNCAHSRDAGSFLSVLKKRGGFDAVMFAPGTARVTSSLRHNSREILQELGLEVDEVGGATGTDLVEESWPETLAIVWNKLPGSSGATAFKSVGEAVRWAQKQAHIMQKEESIEAVRDVHVLVSGSLLLVGDVLEELHWRPAKDGLKVEL